MSFYRIGIALLGKGATNHLHRQEVVNAFRDKGIEVLFLVRGDYLPLLHKLSGCNYIPCRFHKETGWRASLRNFFRNTRHWYPSWDIGKRIRFKAINRENRRLRVRLLNLFIYLLARYRFIMWLMVYFEGWLYRSKTVVGIDPSMFDQLLLLGFGAYGSELDGVLTWWARQNGIPVIHTVGNYDNLSTKGYHGVPIDRLLVWGASMHQDAHQLHGIPEDKIITVGSIKYNSAKRIIRLSKEAFYNSCGLDPEKKTLLFAGSLHEYQYTEMVSIFKHLNRNGNDYQLIMRIYPNKMLMNSPYMEMLIAYASDTPGVYVSLADPHYHSGARDREVPQIEEFELWHFLAYCDVVINFFSTIALEACIFDKPVINMLYFPEQGKLMLRQPVYMNPIHYMHIRKLMSFGAMRIASSCEELINMLKKDIQQPGLLRNERKKVVEYECGVIDGKACERLVQACIDAFNSR